MMGVSANSRRTRKRPHTNRPIHWDICEQLTASYQLAGADVVTKRIGRCVTKVPPRSSSFERFVRAGEGIIMAHKAIRRSCCRMALKTGTRKQTTMMLIGTGAGG